MSNCIFLLVPFNTYRADSEDYINVAWESEATTMSPGDRKSVPRNKSRWLFLKRLMTMAKKKSASVQRGQVKLREKKLKDGSSSLYLDINVGGKRHRSLHQPLCRCFLQVSWHVPLSSSSCHERQNVHPTP